jgi:hypothetical protein
MKDSWSHGDDRRDRGRVDRGVTRPRRSRSPPPRRSEGDRDSKGRDQSVVKSRPISDNDRPRERSPDRRRRPSRSPLRESGEEVRERNRGRELLDTRGSDKPKRSTHHTPSGKRRKSRSPSPSRSHHKKSRRDPSRSPERLADSASSSRREKKRRNTIEIRITRVDVSVLLAITTIDTDLHATALHVATNPSPSIIAPHNVVQQDLKNHEKDLSLGREIGNELILRKEDADLIKIATAQNLIHVNHRHVLPEALNRLEDLLQGATSETGHLSETIIVNHQVNIPASPRTKTQNHPSLPQVPIASRSSLIRWPVGAFILPIKAITPINRCKLRFL